MTVLALRPDFFEPGAGDSERRGDSVNGAPGGRSRVAGATVPVPAPEPVRVTTTAPLPKLGEADPAPANGLRTATPFDGIIIHRAEEFLPTFDPGERTAEPGCACAFRSGSCPCPGPGPVDPGIATTPEPVERRQTLAPGAGAVNGAGTAGMAARSNVAPALAALGLLLVLAR